MALVKKGKLKYLSYMAWIGGITLVVLTGGFYGIAGLILVFFGDWMDDIDGDTGWIEHDTEGMDDMDGESVNDQKYRGAAIK